MPVEQVAKGIGSGFVQRFDGKRELSLRIRKRGAGDMLRRGGDIDVRCADFEKFAADGLMREFRTVAVGAQVPKIKMFEVRGDNFAGELCGGVVGEMAVPADDALLDAPWAARVVL